MMTSQILKFLDFTKTWKSRYPENETIFFSSNKKIHYLHIKGYFMTKNTLLAEVTFKLDSLKETLLSYCELIYQWRISIQKSYTDSWLNIFKSPFDFLYSISALRNHAKWPTCSWDTADLRISKFDQLKAFSTVLN